MEERRFSEGLERVLREMCKRAGVRFEDVDFSDPEWYLKHEWTLEEEADFVEWLTTELSRDGALRRELMEIPFSNKRHLRMFAIYFVSNYGWKVKV